MDKYVGLTTDRFKDRYSKHKQDLDKPQNRTNTTLAGHVWDLKDQKTDIEIKWEIVCSLPSSQLQHKYVVEPMKWHERVKFQRSAFGRSTAVNDVVATVFISLSPLDFAGGAALQAVSECPLCR